MRKYSTFDQSLSQMILLLHNNAKTFVRATKDGRELKPECRTLINVFWEMAGKFPEELIVWRDKKVNLQMADDLSKKIPHELIMASYAVENQFIPSQIEYIDQLPFVAYSTGIIYPTWRMSSDIGGIFGSTLLKFRSVFNNINSFSYLLNAIAKTGQQNGLLCYSDPDLIIGNQSLELKDFTNDSSLFTFVAQHYKKEWLWVLFFCIYRYEKRFPWLPLLKSLVHKSWFKKNILLPIEEIGQQQAQDKRSTVDVIIPTLSRPIHLKNILIDLMGQSLLPKRVIIVEQDPNPDSESQLTFLLEPWPFEIIHHFIHRTGACHARNLAMESVTADYIFFADDDIRIGKDLLENTLREFRRLGVGCISFNCLQSGQVPIFHKIKQWGAFGSGSSVVRSEFALKCRFSKAFEFGYGEDTDFGMQLRKMGCDIIYHPELKIQHLKAPLGGFRKKTVLDWEKEGLNPKPSPTVMLLARRYYTKRQIRGFKISLYIKYYRKQKEKNPLTYLKKMEESWKKSEEWAERLETAAAHSGNKERKALG